VSAPGIALTLGPLRANDRDRIPAMVEATGVFRPDEVVVAVEVFDGAVTTPGVDYHGIGAYEDDRLVGFVLYGHTPCTVATWDLYWIVVDTSMQRGGVGRRLMEAAEHDIAAHNGTLVVVETSSRDDYEPTRRFYDSIGYDSAALIPHYYAPDDDLVVYTKLLDPPEQSVGHYG
jgi:ribosomal protein S18 acetylase RimI-like enzyme